MGTLAVFLAMAWLTPLLIFRRDLVALWREPVLRHPVLILESDDWGAGPAWQGQALRALAAVGAEFRDAAERRPVTGIGVILAVAGVPDGSGRYCRRSLAEPEHADISKALREGRAAGAFALQLHGMEHYWPPALLRAAGRDPRVSAWLADPGLTEDLPSHLQSRWTDASVLPSRPLSDREIEAAVREEARGFEDLFGVPAEVVVPPTFVWDARVEAAFAAAGARFVVTPGRRCEGRDASGRPAGSGEEIQNGMLGAGGVRYLVRDDYFEPARGHRAADALRAVRKKTELGRPCLVEIHRFNFLDDGRLPATLAEVRELYRTALEAFPDLRFMAPRELGEAMLSGDPELIERCRMARFAVWSRRAARVPRFGRLARLTGLALSLRLAAGLLAVFMKAVPVSRPAFPKK